MAHNYGLQQRAKFVMRELSSSTARAREELVARIKIGQETMTPVVPNCTPYKCIMLTLMSDINICLMLGFLPRISLGMLMSSFIAVPFEEELSHVKMSTCDYGYGNPL